MNRDDATRHPIEALSALLDGELVGSDRRAVESHVEGCADCRDLLEDLRTLDRAVAAEPVPATPPDLARRIAAALPERASTSPAVTAAVPAIGSRSWFRAPMPLAAAASLTVATLVWLAWPGGSPRIEAPEVDAPYDASIPVSPPAAADRGTASEEARMDVPLAPPPPPPPAVPKKAADQESRRTVQTSPRQERRAQSPAASEAEAPARVEETGGFSFETRSDRPDDAGVADLVRGDAAAKPAEKAGAEGIGAAPSPAAEFKSAPAPESAERAAGQQRLRIQGRNDKDAQTLPHGFSDPGARENPMTLRADPYLVQLLPGDRMRVESANYACTIDLLPDDALRLAEQYAALRQAGAATIPGPGKGGAGAAPASPRAAGSPAAGPVAASPSAAVPVEASPEGRALIMRLVRERYRAALAERCGPPPR